MKGIGGNITADIQIRTAVENIIGEQSEAWETVQLLTGWLDLQSGDSKYQTYSAKMQESTHVFVCDYVTLSAKVKAENSRLLINGKTYAIMLIDNPMELNKQLEIYLKFTGGQ